MEIMGVDLSAIVQRSPTTLKDHSGWYVAVDGYNVLYQFLSSIRQPDGTPLMDSGGRITSHVSGVFYRSITLLENGIVPIYVFDGKPSPLKARTLDERRLIKEKNRLELQEAIEKGDTERVRSLTSRINVITGEMIMEVKEVLGYMGLQWVQAPSEGEAQASWMSKTGLVHGVISQDYDCLLFGARKVLRNFTVSGRRKLPGKNIYVNVSPEVADLEKTLTVNGITHEQLVDIGILTGTDFNKGLERVGAKTALNLIRKHGDIFHVLREKGTEIPNLDAIRDLFMNPPTVETQLPGLKRPDISSLMKFLCDERGFTQQRVDPYVSKLDEIGKKSRQSNLDLF